MSNQINQPIIFLSLHCFYCDVNLNLSNQINQPIIFLSLHYFYCDVNLNLSNQINQPIIFLSLHYFYCDVNLNLSNQINQPIIFLSLHYFYCDVNLNLSNQINQPILVVIMSGTGYLQQIRNSFTYRFSITYAFIQKSDIFLRRSFVLFFKLFVFVFLNLDFCPGFFATFNAGTMKLE